MRWHFRDRTLEDGFRLKNIRIRQPFARNLPYKSEDLMRLFSRFVIFFYLKKSITTIFTSIIELTLPTVKDNL